MTNEIKFITRNEPIMTIHDDGRITLSEDAQPTEAAAACIEAMSVTIQEWVENAALRQPTQSDTLREENERLRILLRRTMTMAISYATGTGTMFDDVMAEAGAALQEQSK